MKKALLIESQYLPCIDYFHLIKEHDIIVIDSEEKFIKQSFRNRCNILLPNKVATLSIPVLKDSRGNSIIEGKLYKDISRASSSGQYSIFYNINTYIVWEVNNFFFNSSKLDTLKFNAYQIQFHIQ